MDKRNQLTVLIISLIIIGGSIATPLTIRDHTQILDDFLHSPLFPVLPNEGTLKLYFESDFTEENTTLPLSLDYGIKASNISVIVQRIWINITEIQLVGKRAGNSVFFTSDDVFDILDGLYDTKLLKSGNLTAAEYSGIQLFFNTTVLIQTNEDIFYFELQGKDFVVLSFNMFGQENSMIDLNIVEDTISEVILDFNLEILWQNSTVRMTTKALVLN